MEMGLSFVPVRKLMHECTGGTADTIKLFEGLRDYCGFILENARKNWKWAKQYRAYIELLESDIQMLSGTAKVLDLATVALIKTDGAAFAQDRIDKFYDLCDTAEVWFEEAV